MSVDIQQLREIHRILAEVNESTRQIKTLAEAYDEHLADLPEHIALVEAETAVKEARERLKIAVRDDHDLAKLEVQIGEAKYQRRDLNEILSHHIVAYHEETGRDVLKDNESTNRQIVLNAKLGKPTLDQPKLPLGINRHFGQRVEIPASPATIIAQTAEQTTAFAEAGGSKAVA